MSDATVILARFPRGRSAVLPALQALQTELGHLSRETLAVAAAHLRVPASEVWGVATDYPDLRLEPRAPHHVRVCAGLACRLCGGGGARAAAERGSGTECEVEEADCLFACAVAPVIEVDGTYHGRASAGAVERILRDANEGLRGGDGTTERRAAPRLSRASARSAQEALEALVVQARATRRAAATMRLIVQGGTCGRAVGSARLLAALDRAAAERRIPADVVDGACSGMCYAAPAVAVERAGWPRFVLERVDPGNVDALVDLLATDHGDLTTVARGVVWADAPWRGLVPAREHLFWRDQERVLLARSGWLDPGDLGESLVAGAYAALARALDTGPEAVIEEVRAAGLEGRGGAFFPTAAKWDACRRSDGAPKYVVLNGEEGEPGIFKDRHLLEGDPHQVLEGVLLAAYAVGATRAVLYVHGDADLAAARLARGVEAAEAAGLVGDAILGGRFDCRLELRRGGGGFVLGEETALLESIEGRRAQPRARPPFPVEAGLWGKPTVVNNVETLAAVPAIVGRGGAWFAALGAAKAAGTKVFGLSGPLARPGVVEVRGGVTLARLLETIAGGASDGRPLLGAVVGGPSGTIVPRALFDAPMVARERVSPGTGGITALPSGASVVDVVRTLLDFNARESCGKCTPCREGVPRLLALLDQLAATRDPAPLLAEIRELGGAVRLASLCGLGQSAPLALLDALDAFPEAFEARR